MQTNKDREKESLDYVPVYEENDYEDRYEDLHGILEAKKTYYLGEEKDFNPNDPNNVPLEWSAYFERLDQDAARRMR